LDILTDVTVYRKNVSGDLGLDLLRPVGILESVPALIVVHGRDADDHELEV
jgi:hypothetical protein